MITFWILWIYNALVAMVPVFFFFVGLSDGSIDSDNLWMWLIILLIVGLLLGGTYWLKTKSQLAIAKVLLIIAAVPSILFILYFAVAFATDVRWN